MEYFEDIRALETKVDCIELEIADKNKIKDKLMKKVRKYVKRIPDKYDDEAIHGRIGQKYIVLENLKIEVDDYREHSIMLARQL